MKKVAIWNKIATCFNDELKEQLCKKQAVNCVGASFQIHIKYSFWNDTLKESNYLCHENEIFVVIEQVFGYSRVLRLKDLHIFHLYDRCLKEILQEFV